MYLSSGFVHSIDEGPRFAFERKACILAAAASRFDPNEYSGREVDFPRRILERVDRSFPIRPGLESCLLSSCLGIFFFCVLEYLWSRCHCKTVARYSSAVATVGLVSIDILI